MLPALDTDLEPEMSDTWEKKDADRVYMSDYQALSNTKVKRKKKRKEKLKDVVMRLIRTKKRLLRKEGREMDKENQRDIQSKREM